jgi:hypothetical protein
LTIPRALGPVSMFCAPELIFVGTEGFGSSFHFLRSGTHFGRYRGHQVPFWSCFVFCAPELIFVGTEGSRSSFHVLSSHTRFRRYYGHRVQYSCFAQSDSFSAIPMPPGPVSMFCAPKLIFISTEGSGFSFLSFMLRDSVWAILRAPSLVFMFSALGLVFGGTKGVGSSFQVLRYRTHFRRYRGHRVQFSCFMHPNSFWEVPRAPGPVLSSLTRFQRYRGHPVQFYVLGFHTRFRQYRGRRVQSPYFLLPD